MKFTMNRITRGEDEVILNYLEMNAEVERIANFLRGEQTKLIGWIDKVQTVIEPKNILYIESVDGRTYAYTKEDVVKLDFTLQQMERILCDINFFRCSKSMILNIDEVNSLRSLPSNRIDAEMRNGEHIMISRTYASDFRRRLKGAREDE